MSFLRVLSAGILSSAALIAWTSQSALAENVSPEMKLQSAISANAPASDLQKLAAQVRNLNSVQGGLYRPLIVTATQLAGSEGKENGLRFLLSKKVNLNVYEADGQSPLGIAASSCRPDLVRALLKAGADPMMENPNYRVTQRAVDVAGYVKNDGPRCMEGYKILKSATHVNPMQAAIESINSAWVSAKLLNAYYLGGAERAVADGVKKALKDSSEAVTGHWSKTGGAR